MELINFLSFAFGFALGALFLIPCCSSKKQDKGSFDDSYKINKKYNVKVKITYDNIRKTYFVYYNGYCQKSFDSFDKAKNWAESNVDNYVKGIEVKYEKEY